MPVKKTNTHSKAGEKHHVGSELVERQTKGRPKNRIFENGRADTPAHVAATPLRHPLHTTRVRIRATRHGGATGSMDSLHRHHGKRYEDYKHLKDVLHRARQGSLEELKKMKYELFLEKPLARIIHLQTYGN